MDLRISPKTYIVAGFFSTYFLHKKPLRGDIAVLIELALFIVIFTTSYFSSQLGTLPCALSSSLAIVYHLSTIAATTVIYRLSPYHPLWTFPGPFVNKITSLRMMFVILSGKRYSYVDELHKKYGKIVRTGPNTLSINSYDAISPIYSSATAFDKSNNYIPGRLEGNGLFFMRAKDEHNVRRRLWAGAFTSQFLAKYKPFIEKRASDLQKCIDSRANAAGAVDLGTVIRHWSYDVMGDLTFGQSNNFELMRDGDPDGLITSGQQAHVLFESLGEVPSLFDILTYFSTTRELKALENCAEKMLLRREKNDHINSNDLVSHLLGHHSSKANLSFSDRRLDSLFAIQAGSDTTSSVLIYLLYLLLSNAHSYSSLQKELDLAFPDPDGNLSWDVLNSLPYLNAVINEALRIGTPFHGFPRVVPKDGACISGTHIPGGTIVSVNTYSQHISEENFYPDPLAYRPERWLPGGLGPDSITRKSAILAFAYGPFGCLGKTLAIQELQMATAKLVLLYDLSFHSEFSSRLFMDGIENTGTTIFRYPLMVVAAPRIK